MRFLYVFRSSVSSVASLARQNAINDALSRLTVHTVSYTQSNLKVLQCCLKLSWDFTPGPDSDS